MNKDKLIAEMEKMATNSWDEHENNNQERYWLGKSRAFSHSATVINRMLEGYVIVPEEPTKEMLKHAWTTEAQTIETYKAMIATYKESE